MIRNSFVASSIFFGIGSYLYIKKSNEDMKKMLLEKGYMDENNQLKSKAMKNILGSDYYSSVKVDTQEKEKSEKI